MMDFLSQSLPSGLEYLTKAHENYKCAYYAKSNGWYNASASRLYYAVRFIIVEYFNKIEEKLPREHGQIPVYLAHVLQKRYGNKIEHTNISNIPSFCYTLREKADYMGGTVKERDLNSRFEAFSSFIDYFYSKIVT